jgi:glycine cleavage system aminomethyltransferase T
LCCRVAAPTARIARCGWTGQKSAEVVVPAGDQVAAGKDRTSSEAEESVLLVLVAVIAAIPRTRASCWKETVSSVECRS